MKEVRLGGLETRVLSPKGFDARDLVDGLPSFTPTICVLTVVTMVSEKVGRLYPSGGQSGVG